MTNFELGAVFRPAGHYEVRVYTKSCLDGEQCAELRGIGLYHYYSQELIKCVIMRTSSRNHYAVTPLTISDYEIMPLRKLITYHRPIQ